MNAIILGILLLPSNAFAAGPPTIDTVYPSSGSTLGGTQINVTGTNFDPYLYRRSININNPGSALYDFPIQATIDTESLISAGKLKADGSDLRFISTDEATEYPYWIDSSTLNTAATKIWIKIPTLESGSTIEIYATYGNYSCTAASSGESVFNFFDDFNGSAIDTSKWTITNSTGFSVGNGELHGTNTTGRLTSIQTFNSGVALEIKSRRVGDTSANGNMIGGFFLTTSNGFGLLNHPGTDYYWNNGSWTALSTTVPASTDLLTKISVKSASQLDLSVTNFQSGTSYQSANNVSNNVAAEPIVLGKRYDSDSYNNQAYSSYWDWIRVRPYATTEPSVVVGVTEEGGALLIDGATAKNISNISSTTIEALTLQHTAGMVDVTVKNIFGETATLESGFTYSDDEPGIRVLTPNGGETWEAGTWHNITWETTDTPDLVNIYLSTDNGSNYTIVATGEADDGSFPWFVPGPVSTLAKIKLEAVKNGLSSYDESDDSFSVTAANNVFVDAVNGNNSYSGLTSEVYTSGGVTHGPWKNIVYAVSNSAVGAAIYVAPGIYNTTAGETFPITVSSGRKLIGSGRYLTTVEASGTDMFTLQTNAGISDMYIGLTSGNYKVIKVLGSGIDIRKTYIKGGGWNSDRGTGIYFDGQNGT
ncbi:MAG: DUF2341 domain-containing protein, partial [Candidatus Margulisiibacteriota bacterium]